MAPTPQTEHECNAYCRDGHHADVFWTPLTDEQIAESAPRFLANHGLRLIHWQRAPEATVPRDETLIRYNAANGEQDFAPPGPTETPVLMVWEVAAPAPAATPPANHAG